jgi:hypothetical protein
MANAPHEHGGDPHARAAVGRGARASIGPVLGILPSRIRGIPAARRTEPVAHAVDRCGAGPGRSFDRISPAPTAGLKSSFSFLPRLVPERACARRTRRGMRGRIPDSGRAYAAGCRPAHPGNPAITDRGHSGR